MKRAHHRNLVCQLGQAWYPSAKSHSRQGGWDHITHRAHAQRRVWLRIKRLVLAWSALLKQENDRLAGKRIRLAVGQGLNAEQRR